MAISLGKRYTPSMIPIQKLRPEQPFLWLRQSVFFLNRNFGDVLLISAISTLLGIVLNAIPGIGAILYPVYSAFAIYGIYCYLGSLEAGNNPPLKTLFIIFKRPDDMKKVFIILLLGVATLILSTAIVFWGLAMLLWLQGAFSFDQTPNVDSLKAFALDHYIQIPFVLVIGILPALFFYGSFYFAIPLVATHGLNVSDALNASFKANVKNWLPLTAFWLFFTMAILMYFGMLGILALFGGTVGKMLFAVTSLATAMVGTLYVFPLLTVQAYAIFVGIFENRHVQVLPRAAAVVETTPRSADPYTDTKIGLPSSDQE